MKTLLLFYYLCLYILVYILKFKSFTTDLTLITFKKTESTYSLILQFNFIFYLIFFARSLILCQY